MYTCCVNDWKVIEKYIRFHAACKERNIGHRKKQYSKQIEDKSIQRDLSSPINCYCRIYYNYSSF